MDCKNLGITMTNKTSTAPVMADNQGEGHNLELLREPYLGLP